MCSHHPAIRVADLDLDMIYQKLAADENVVIKFAPEPLRNRPTTRMICYEPGGIRIDFIVPA